MNVLPSLKRLQKISVDSSSGTALECLEQKISNAVLELRNVKEIDILLLYGMNYRSRSFSDLRDTIDTVNQRQACRCDLMF